MSEMARYSEHQPKADELKDEAVGLPPADVFDPVIEACKKDVDRTLLRENLDLTQSERAEKFVKFARFAEELCQAGQRARAQDPSWGLK
jgi:hypothetical protein